MQHPDTPALRIVIYVHDLRTSGVVRDSLGLATYCAARHPVTVVAGYRSGWLEEAARTGPFALVTLRDRPGDGAGRLAPAPALRAWLRRQGDCVLVSMGNHGHATAWLATRGLARVRRIYRISNEVARGDGLKGWFRTRWMRCLIADAARLPLVGAALAANPLFAPALARGVAVEIPSGVDLARARSLAAAPRPHPWLAQDVPVVLGIGRLRPQKNFPLLIAAVGQLHARRPVRLVILGGGSVAERTALELAARRARLGEDFLLAGETDNVFAWLARARVFVLPSRWEGSSVALLEALATGIPVVASRCAGDAAQVLDEGRFGLLCDGEDPSALAAAIARQLSTAAVLPGERARQYAEPWAAYLSLIEALPPR